MQIALNILAIWCLYISFDDVLILMAGFDESTSLPWHWDVGWRSP